jgi:hypothetical protein
MDAHGPLTYVVTVTFIAKIDCLASCHNEKQESAEPYGDAERFREDVDRVKNVPIDKWDVAMVVLALLGALIGLTGVAVAVFRLAGV